jgi:hypothetical protein
VINTGCLPVPTAVDLIVTAQQTVDCPPEWDHADE